MGRALAGRALPAGEICLLTMGKAADGLAAGLVEWLDAAGRVPAAGLIIGTDDIAAPHPALRSLRGDHPVPGGHSLAASIAIAEAIATFPPQAEVHVAISGGTSAMIAGPLPGLSMADLTGTFEVLLASGLDIERANAVRKRVARWTAGRLALALRPRRVVAWLLSDVPGDDPEVIGSGPCVGDHWSARQVVALCRDAGLLSRLPSAVVAALEFETPKVGDRRATADSTTIIGSNRIAMEAAVARAWQLGCFAKTVAEPLSGMADVMGRRIAAALVRARAGRFAGEAAATVDAPNARVFVYGGETTVQVPAGSGTGGRSQELALAAAEVLHGQRGIHLLLAAGTDGRDGPTDAAGAVVDSDTWDAILRRGLDPAELLARHDSYTALDAAGALIRTGHTGTNVMDLVLTLTAG